MVESSGVAGQVCVSEQFKEELENEAPKKVKFNYHDTIHFMSLAKEQNDVKCYLTEPYGCESWLRFADDELAQKRQEEEEREKKEQQEQRRKEIKDAGLEHYGAGDDARI